MNNSNNQMENFMEEIEKSMIRLHPGDIVDGKIINVTDNEIMVNVGYKSDGIIPRDEISNDPSVNPHNIAKIGAEIKVYVIKVDDGEGNVLLSKKRVEYQQTWNEFQEIKKNGTLLEVKVAEVVNGGVIALAKGIKCFIPASQLSDRYVDDLKSFIGQTFNTKILEIDRKKNKVVLSRKIVIQEENKFKRNELFSKLEKGQRLQGEIKQLTNFGAFADIGGIDGLIHISELSWGRVKHPSEVVSVGDKVEVELIEFDIASGKISLSLKNTIAEPWSHAAEKYKAGDIIEGKVVRLVGFGAFVEIQKGMDGLVHISQISEKHIAKPSDVLKIGQIVKVKILDMNIESKRVSLSIIAADKIEEEKIQQDEN